MIKIGMYLSVISNVLPPVKKSVKIQKYNRLITPSKSILLFSQKFIIYKC